jgi:hypothetical protein
MTPLPATVRTDLDTTRINGQLHYLQTGLVLSTDGATIMLYRYVHAVPHEPGELGWIEDGIEWHDRLAIARSDAHARISSSWR